MEVLIKDMIEEWIISDLSKGKRGPKPTVELWRVVQLILYRLKVHHHPERILRLFLLQLGMTN